MNEFTRVKSEVDHFMAAEFERIESGTPAVPVAAAVEG
jgi:hypothetical protein